MIVTVIFSPTTGWAGSIVTPFLSLKVKKVLLGGTLGSYGIKRCFEVLPQRDQIGSFGGSRGGSLSGSWRTKSGMLALSRMRGSSISTKGI